ncbi:GTP-binding protein 1-like [Paramacrobiotus metropolitanus]|uniref:GTP-binding protein 1-like n=1 Tax=Paramacrobiotus metropolitanus TaxID=2943436 RepID=UPI00244584E4|nr:GTP-binding protein 1-like [Paramacrobiotus metropolitanus]
MTDLWSVTQSGPLEAPSGRCRLLSEPDPSVGIGEVPVRPSGAVSRSALLVWKSQKIGQAKVAGIAFAINLLLPQSLDSKDQVVAEAAFAVNLFPTTGSSRFSAKLCLYRLLKGSGGQKTRRSAYHVTGNNDGFTEPEMTKALETLLLVCQTAKASCIFLRQRKSDNGIINTYLIRRQADEEDFLEVRIAVLGNVDAGKSTLLGVLTHGELDNGRGLARMKLFRHKHEQESGRTSSVGHDILGFDADGKVVNRAFAHGNDLDWEGICKQSSKVITFIDLAGHEKYLKTTIFGMTGHLPDFCMLVVGANAGVVGMVKEHLGLTLALAVPVFVVVTKIDMCPANVLQDTLKLLQKLMKSPGCRKIPIMVANEDDVVTSASNFTSSRVCPIFQLSSVTGANMELLHKFLNLLTSRHEMHEAEPAEFQIDETYSVPGVGTVVSGTVLRGVIRLNDTLMLGPDALGHFQAIAVKSIHRKRMPVSVVRGGQAASFALKKIKRSHLRKGMVMVAPAMDPKACWEFETEMLILHHPSTLQSGYQAMVHTGSCRQTIKILSMSQDCLRTGDKALVRCRFIKLPEFLRPGQRMILREGRTKAVGNITQVFLDAPAGNFDLHPYQHPRPAAPAGAGGKPAGQAAGSGAKKTTGASASGAGRGGHNR